MSEIPPLTIDPDAPADPVYVLELAEALAEIVRALNHLTRHHEALHYPSEADGLVQHLAAAAGRLPQLLSQLSAWLNEEYAEGRIRMTGGEFPQAVLAVMAAEARLGKAAEHAEALRQALESAASVTSCMAAAGDDGSEEGEAEDA